MMTFHKLLVIASAIQCYVHKILRTVRGGENPTGPKLPDFIVHVNTVKYDCLKPLFLLNAVYCSFG